MYPCNLLYPRCSSPERFQTAQLVLALDGMVEHFRLEFRQHSDCRRVFGRLMGLLKPSCEQRGQYKDECDDQNINRQILTEISGRKPESKSLFWLENSKLRVIAHTISHRHFLDRLS